MLALGTQILQLGQTDRNLLTHVSVYHHLFSFTFQVSIFLSSKFQIVSKRKELGQQLLQYILYRPSHIVLSESNQLTE